MAKKGDIDVLFMGDSITDFWRNATGPYAGKPVQVPGLFAETPEEQARLDAARQRLRVPPATLLIGTIGKLVNDDTTVDNLNSTLKSVESGVQSLKAPAHVRSSGPEVAGEPLVIEG